jgi:hypothetical protein
MYQGTRWIITGLLVCMGLLSAGKAEAGGKHGAPSCPSQLDTCTKQLTDTQNLLAICTNELTTTESDLMTCASNYNTCIISLNTCTTNLAACEAQPVAPIPKTGQTLCFDWTGNQQIDCAGTGQDGEYQAGVVWPSPRFSITYCDISGPCAVQSSDCDGNSATDIVTDNLTGLVWTRDANLPNSTKTWDQSLYYADNLNLCGYSDWRLPNVRELPSLIDYGRYNYPALPALLATRL